MFVLFNNQKEFIGYSDQLPPTIQYYQNIGENFDINKRFYRNNNNIKICKIHTIPNIWCWLITKKT